MFGTRRALLPLLVVVSLAAPALAQAPRSDAERVRADLAAIASQVEATGGADLAYVGSLSAVNFIRERAWIYTVSGEALPAYGGAFFVYSEVDGVATGELLAGAGPEGVRVMRGEELARYLERVELDPTPLRAVFERWYRPRPPPPR